jgi:hypothetical protein
LKLEDPRHLFVGAAKDVLLGGIFRERDHAFPGGVGGFMATNAGARRGAMTMDAWLWRPGWKFRLRQAEPSPRIVWRGT